MRRLILTGFVLGVLVSASLVHAQTKRTDAVWARTVPPGTIKLDGHLDEAAWATADSIHVYYGKSSGQPGSGWADEQNLNKPADPTRATIKFLVSGDTLWMGAWVPDSSIGTNGDFNYMDGFLINIRDVSNPMYPASHEYFYAWQSVSWGDTATGFVGAMPAKIGGSATDTTWGAKTYVLGTTNSDTTANGTFSPDTGYYIEMYLYLGPRGYKLDTPGDHAVLFNMAIYDNDWFWPFDPTKASVNHSWIQGPWSGDSWYDLLRIYSNPNVTSTSGAAPAIQPDYVVPNGKNFTPPAIAGTMTSPVWANVKGFELDYGDSASSAVRQSYGAAGALMSGSTQWTLSGQTAPATVTDPNTAAIKAFFIGDTLYLGADVNDQVVTYESDDHQWDGIRFTITDRSQVDTASHYNEMKTWDLVIRVDSLGNARLENDGPYLVDSIKAVRAALTLKPGTQVNNPLAPGTGYTVDAAFDLTKFGYSHGLGDGALWLGVGMFDGDTYTSTTDNTGTYTWWFKGNYRYDPGSNNAAGPAWCYMDPNTLVTGVEQKPQATIPAKFELVGNYPNPFNPSTRISFSMPQAARVTLTVYNILGQLVRSVDLGVQSAGDRIVSFDGSRLSSGVYLYQLRIQTPSGHVQSTSVGKMLLLK